MTPFQWTLTVFFFVSLLGFLLTWPFHLRLRLSRQSGQDPRLRLRIGPVVAVDKPLFTWLAKRINAPKKKKRSLSGFVVLRALRGKIQVDRLEVRLRVGLSEAPDLTALTAGSLEVLAACFQESTSLDVRIEPAFGADTLEGEISCIFWTRIWHIMLMSLYLIKENRKHASH